MTVQIRPAQAGDQRTIRSIVRGARLYPFGLRWEHFLVAEEQGAIVGVGQVWTHRDGNRELASIAVLPSHQGRGIGDRVVRALLARESGTVHLMCALWMQGLYERYGFRPIATKDAPPALRWKVRIGQGIGALITWRSGRRVGVTAMRLERNPRGGG